MHRLLALCLVSSLAIVVAEETVAQQPSDEADFRRCEDVLVDDVIEMAFGDQGQPFTGKVRCYYDKEKRFPKSDRVFDEGVAIGTHHCYYRNGPVKYSIMYKNGKRHKLGSEFFTRRFSTKNEDGNGYRFGRLFIFPGEYREIDCRDGVSSMNHCMKGGWINCF